MEKSYDHNKYEKSIYRRWEPYFAPSTTLGATKGEPFCIIMPPPNANGELHLGHATFVAISDALIRFHRMKGSPTLWLPGVDHAGILTQVTFEKKLKKEEGKTRHDLGRQEFYRRCYEFCLNNKGLMEGQLRSLGASCDWGREKFTLDPKVSRLVYETFEKMNGEGLVYRGYRIVNWCPRCRSTLADVELEWVERKDPLYYMKYGPFVLATVRPETKFGDTAVAVNPKDKRYKKYVGEEIEVEGLLGSFKIKVIEDDKVDPEFGTGVVKVTPGHDPLDWEMGQRHGLETKTVIDFDGRLNELTGPYKGLKVEEARKKVVEDLKAKGLIEKIDENYLHQVATCERCGVMIEPLVSRQWFVKIKSLAEKAIKAAEEGRIKIVPRKYEAMYFNWMRQIKDWPISRQIWWGHQLPAWYARSAQKTKEQIKEFELLAAGDTRARTDLLESPIISVTRPEGNDEFIQDPDTFDAWFSSGQWPVNTLKTSGEDDLARFYPTSVMNTAYEILFLWVARMIMAGLEYKKDIPFKEVYFNSIVRDGKGRKMSKTLGNSPDPLVVMDKYGTDALRFTLVYLAPLGNDVLFDEDKTEIGRNFVTKLWNAGRFLLMNKDKIYSSSEYGDEILKDDFIDKWMDSRFNSELEEVERCLNEYKLNDYTKALYNFVWSDFCDWYIEILKIKIDKYPESAKYNIDKALNIYENIIKLLHPVIPFVTEEIWHILNESRDGKSISFADFPELEKEKINSDSEKEFEIFQEIVSGIRNLKAENDIPYSEKCKVFAICSDKFAEITFDEYYSYIFSLCNLASLEKIKKLDGDKYLSKVLADFEIHIPFEVNEKQIEKYKKEIENLEKYIDNIDKKLSNQNFVEKAPKELIESEKAKREEAMAKLEKLKKLV